MNMRQKKGVSPIIATVLLIILTLVAVSILAVFVVRFVRDGLSSDDCYKILNKVKLEEDSEYHCSYNNGTDKRTGFSVRIDSDDVAGFSALLSSGGSANSHRIELNGSDPLVRMLDRNFGEQFDVPTSGGVRTYVAKDLYSSVEISAILKSGKVCETHEKIEPINCINQNVITNLFKY